MRRVFAILTVVSVLLCVGCGSTESHLEEAITFRAELVQAGGCTFQSQITADYGDQVERFTVNCQGDAEGTVHLTIVEPAVLEGVTATVTEGGGAITYDGLSVDFGLLAQGNVIPAAAPSIVLTCWLSEYISAAGQEGEYYRVTYQKDYEEKQLIVETYFKNGLPNYAEVCYNNQGVLKLQFSEFQLRT